MSSTRIFIKYIFLLLAFIGSFAGTIMAQTDSTNAKLPPDSLRTAEEEYRYIRGIERDKKEGGEVLRKAGDVLLFIPRTLIDGLLYATVYSAYLVDDSKIVAKIEDFLYLKGRVLGWYPLLTFGSGPAIGATVFYRTKPFEFSIGGAYGSSQRWGGKINLLHAFAKGKTVWQINFSGKIIQRTDYEFNGFGADPQNDPRNSFQPGATKEFGLFSQRLTRVPLVIGVRPSPKWQFFYSVFYQERRLTTPPDGNRANIENTFNLNDLPGIDKSITTTGKQVYNEIAVRFENRTFPRQESPAVRVEGYTGVSLGVSNDESRFARAGLDLALYVPILRHNRLIVPRMVFDMIENLNDEVELSFAEYPRQPTFRGISQNKLLRTDKYSLVPSLEYQWPLTFSLRSHLFVDYLLVSDSFDHFTFSGAPFAYGFEIELHSDDHEIARFTISTGSEGLRFLFNIGLGQYTSDRTKWQ